MAYRHIIYNQKGSVSIESAVLLTLLLIVCTFFLEYFSEKLIQTRLERVNFSLAKIIRERVVLYGGSKNTSEFDENNLLSEQDVIQLADVGKFLMRDSSGQAKNFTLKVEVISFENNKSKLTPHKILSYTVGTSCSIIHEKKLEEFGYLSSWSVNARWMPLYRISMCLPPREIGYLKKYSSNIPGVKEETSVFSIVLSR